MPHQKSNASDDLLLAIQSKNLTALSLYYLRQLPVDITQASQQAIAFIQQIELDGIICCGMAETRDKLTIESRARCHGEQFSTLIDLERLVDGLFDTYISHDAGQFVCEGLYFQILKYLQESQLNIPCIFVHVPILHQENLARIINDFCLILETISVLNDF